MAAVRVLIVEDSPIIAAALGAVLERDPEIELVGMAPDGRKAVESVAALQPSVVVMDVHMPVMGGLEAIERIMAQTPVPILVWTADPMSDALSFEALRRGALELVRKPAALHQSSSEARELVARVKLLASIPVLRRPAPSARTGTTGAFQIVPPRPELRRAAGIVASTGGPGALAELLSRLPAGFGAPIVIVQHLATGFAAGLAAWLAKQTALDVRVAEPGAALVPGAALLAPDGFHLSVSGVGRVLLSEPGPRRPSSPEHVPSGDVMLASLARAYGKSAIGVVLSGMGEDGAAGLLEVHHEGGMTMVQSEASSVIFGMPRAALERGAATRALAPAEIARELGRCCGAAP